MKDILKNIARKAIPFVVCVALLMLPRGCMRFLLFLDGYGRVYSTNSISDYGKIKGNFDNEKPAEFINSFFPENIEEYFSDAQYHYKAKQFDTYAYEAYLEFKIEDKEAFAEYIGNEIYVEDSVQFAYDSSYREITVSNRLDVTAYDDYFAIEQAKLGKILWSEADGTVIYWAMGVYDGGATHLDELDCLFSRFQIDHAEFVSSFLSHISTN